MAISEKDSGLSLDQLRSIAKDQYCGRCGGPLNVAWSASDNSHVLRCHDLTHGTITRHRPKDQYELEHEEAWRKVNKMDSTSLTKMSEHQMIERIKSGPKFPQDLNDREQKMLAQMAIMYGFDPMLGEITIYQGHPWVSIDGRYRKAQESGKLGGVESRPATKKERTDWEIPSGDYFYRTEVYRTDSERPFVAWGRVFERETEIRDSNPGDAYKPTVTNPQRMAEKRAEAQGLRKAFSIPLPPGTLNMEEMGSPTAIQVEARVLQPTAAPTGAPGAVSAAAGSFEDLFGPDRYESPGPGGEVTMTEAEKKKAILEERDLIKSLTTKLVNKTKADGTPRWEKKVLSQKIRDAAGLVIKNLEEIPDDKVNSVAHMLADLDLVP